MSFAHLAQVVVLVGRTLSGRTRGAALHNRAPPSRVWNQHSLQVRSEIEALLLQLDAS